jgi:hypothetical protein
VQRDDQTFGAGAEQGGDAWEFGARDRDRADHAGQSSAGIAPAQDDAAPDLAGAQVPAGAEAAPLIEFLPPLKGVKPDAMQGNEQRALTILGSHADEPPAEKKKRKPDLRVRDRSGRKDTRTNRRGRKQLPYVKRDRAIGDHSFEPTPAQRNLVVAMVGMRVPQNVICTMIGDNGISENTMLKYFGMELMLGREQFVANVKGMLVQAAQGGSVRAMTYLLDRLGGPDFVPRTRANDEIANVPLTINGNADVQIFLPDNRRAAND